MVLSWLVAKLSKYLWNKNGWAPRLPMGGFLFMRNTLWCHISYRFRVIDQNVKIFWRILLYNCRQRWPPFGHFESGDLVFWWVSRHHSLTHLYHKSAPRLVWLWKYPARYVKKHDFGIQNLGSDRPNFFVCTSASWGHMLIPNLVTLAYTVMKTSC